MSEEKRFNLPEIDPKYIRQTWLTHWGLVTHICSSKLTIIGPDNGVSSGLNQYWNIVISKFREKNQINLWQNSHDFIQENAFENDVCEMVANLSRPQCVDIVKLLYIRIMLIQITFQRDCIARRWVRCIKCLIISVWWVPCALVSCYTIRVKRRFDCAMHMAWFLRLLLLLIKPLYVCIYISLFLLSYRVIPHYWLIQYFNVSKFSESR